MAVFFVTKGQAAIAAAAWNQGFAERCFQALNANAQNGVIGATISTAGVGGGSITAATTAMTNTGWTVDAATLPGFLVVS